MIIVLMGVAGAGKTTVGHLLAQQLNWEFVDGDSLHSLENLEKMGRGVPLTDEDRHPWVRTLRKVIDDRISQSKNLVLACSALRQTYRERLGQGPDVKFVYLKGNRDLLYERLRRRRGHVVGPQLLPSQLAILEEPDDALEVDAAKSPDEIASEIRERLLP